MVATLLIAGTAIGCGGTPSTSANPESVTLSPPSSATSTPAPEIGPTAAEVSRRTLSGRVAYSDDGDVYRLDLPDGEPVRLTDDPADEFDPDLSPEGERIAYRVASGRGDEADIWVMNADGSDKRNLTNDPSRSNWAPAWSPDGTRICFNSTRDDSRNRIWLMNPDGGGLRLITQGWGEYCDWSPDGDRVVYAAASGGTYDIWIAALDGSMPTQLTDLPGTEFFPAWSPDGTLIAFEHLEDGIWLVAPNGSDRRFLGEGGAIVWSPDGRLGFDRPGGYSIYDPASDTVARFPLAIGRFPSWTE